MYYGHRAKAQAGATTIQPLFGDDGPPSLVILLIDITKGNSAKKQNGGSPPHCQLWIKDLISMLLEVQNRLPQRTTASASAGVILDNLFTNSAFVSSVHPRRNPSPPGRKRDDGFQPIDPSPRGPFFRFAGVRPQRKRV